MHDQIRSALPEADRARLDEISDSTDPLTGKGRRDEAIDVADFNWIRQHYPQLAQVNDLASYAMELIGSRNLYRELGFNTHEDWHTALDDEQYLERGMSKLAERESR